VVATIVDLNGVRQATLRGDNSPVHSVDNAFFRAYAAASLTLGRNEGPTHEVAERIAKNKPSNVPNTQLPNVTYARGGMAIKAGGRINGGLAVSGAPGGHLDEECGNAARQDQGPAEVVATGPCRPIPRAGSAASSARFRRRRTW
jgi:uncharacterized protein GlcG (DUF336 family)